jgi:hypothetical protein
MLMSSEEIWNFLRDCDSELDSQSKFLYFSRGREFQIEAKDKITTLKQRISEVLKISKEYGYEDLSNRLKGVEALAQSAISELDMYIYLKDNCMSDAWDALISAQMGIFWSMKAHPVFADGLESHAAKLEALEKVLFPSQVFCSAGFTVHSTECSICKKDYKECDHIKGRIYNGEFCGRIITKCTANEVSIVEELADKRCRVQSFGDGATMRDTLTWRIIENT